MSPELDMDALPEAMIRPSIEPNEPNEPVEAAAPCIEPPPVSVERRLSP